jgi:hypothetical protein
MLSYLQETPICVDHRSQKEAEIRYCSKPRKLWGLDLSLNMELSGLFSDSDKLENKEIYSEQFCKSDCVRGRWAASGSS